MCQLCKMLRYDGFVVGTYFAAATDTLTMTMKWLVVFMEMTNYDDYAFVSSLNLDT